MIRILFLSVGTNACYHTSKILKEKFRGEFYVVGADINEQYLVSSCASIDAFYRVPHFANEAYYGTIIDICKKERIDYILPSFDADQKLFYPENEDLRNLGVISLGTKKDTLKIYKDKVTMNAFLRRNKLKIPKIIDPEDIEKDVRYFVKPVNGVGSQGACSIYGSQIEPHRSSDVIVQEECVEPEITLECFCYEGILRTIARERIAAKSGVCVKAKVFSSFELHQIAEKFVEKIETPYFFNLQFMKTPLGESVITDVNLRLAGGMSLSAAAGWDEISALAKIMLGRSKDEVFETLPKVVNSQYVVRAYTDIVTKIERSVVAFDLDGTLLDSRIRHRVVLDDILEKYDIKVDTSDLIEFKRNNKNNVDYLMSKGIEKGIAEEIQASWIEHIEDEEYLVLDSLYDDSTKLLEKYKRDSELILITARSDEQAVRRQLGKLKIADSFKDIFVVSPEGDVSSKKSEILVREKALLMIGDTLSDYKAADKAKAGFIFREHGFHNKEVLIANG